MKESLAKVFSRFPKRIVFPVIDRPHRMRVSSLSDVQVATDLSDRLFFGRLSESEFRHSPTGWGAIYGNRNGDGVELSVSDGQFKATLVFLGAKSVSTGPASIPSAFGELVNLAHPTFDAALRSYLESKYRIAAPATQDDRPVVMGLPDGWSRTFLIPIAASQVPSVVEFHKSMLKDRGLVAPMSGSIHLQFNAINYIEGRVPDHLAGEHALLGRSITYSGTPILELPVREAAEHGSSAWTVRRAAYLYRCCCFMGDAPFVASRLNDAGLLAQAPDFWSAILPTELLPFLKHATWWSGDNACRIFWQGFGDAGDTLLASRETTLNEAEHTAALAAAVSADYIELLTLN